MPSLQIQTQATVPSGASLDLIVEEDTDADGTFENEAVVSVPDGTGTQTLSSFDAADGNDVRVSRRYTTSGAEDGIQLQSVDVQSVVTAELSGTVTDSTGDPVNGATVAVWPHNGTTVKRVTTASNGQYTVDTHPEGDGSQQEWHIAVRHEDADGTYNSESKPFVSASLGAE